MNKSKIMCANNMSITPGLLIKALAWSGLKWHMHVAQFVDIVLNELSPFVGERTFMGIPIQLSEDMPLSTIELMLDGEVIYKIESLSIPSGTPWNYHD